MSDRHPSGAEVVFQRLKALSRLAARANRIAAWRAAARERRRAALAPVRVLEHSLAGAGVEKSVELLAAAGAAVRDAALTLGPWWDKSDEPVVMAVKTAAAGDLGRTREWSKVLRLLSAEAIETQANKLVNYLARDGDVAAERKCDDRIARLVIAMAAHGMTAADVVRWGKNEGDHLFTPSGIALLLRAAQSLPAALTEYGSAAFDPTNAPPPPAQSPPAPPAPEAIARPTHAPAAGVASELRTAELASSGTDRCTLAIAMLTESPVPSLTAIAKRVGVPREALYRNREFERFRTLAERLEAMARKAGGQDCLVRGHKTADGTIEGYAEDDEV